MHDFNHDGKEDHKDYVMYDEFISNDDNKHSSHTSPKGGGSNGGCIAFVVLFVMILFLASLFPSDMQVAAFYIILFGVGIAGVAIGKFLG